MCEPNFDLPQYIDIAEYRKASDTKTECAEEPAAEVDKRKDPVEETYDVLPMGSYNEGNLQKTLSLRENKYLALKWDEFLETKQIKVVQVKLYSELLQRKNVSLAKPMMMTDSFYGFDRKLWPVRAIGKKKK